MNEQPISAGSRAAADIAALLRARNPLLWIVTREEARTERLLMEAAQIAQYEPRFQDCATGITTYDGTVIDARATDPAQAIGIIRDSRQRQMWVMRDLPAFLRDPFVCRALRSLARSLTLAPRDEARAVIVLTPSAEIPPELAGHAISIDFPLPDRSEIAAILDAAIAALPDDLRDTAAPNGTRDAAIDAAVGLTAEEAQACYAKSLVSTRRIDPATVAAEKKRVIAREKVLEWFDPIPGGLDAVGGLDNLKAWLTARRAAFGPRARAYGQGCAARWCAGLRKILDREGDRCSVGNAAFAPGHGRPQIQMGRRIRRQHPQGPEGSGDRRAVRALVGRD